MRQPKLVTGFVGVQMRLLHIANDLDFVLQSMPTAFLLNIEDRATAMVLYLRECCLKLASAITIPCTEDFGKLAR